MRPASLIACIDTCAARTNRAGLAVPLQPRAGHALRRFATCRGPRGRHRAENQVLQLFFRRFNPDALVVKEVRANNGVEVFGIEARPAHRFCYEEPKCFLKLFPEDHLEVS